MEGLLAAVELFRTIDPEIQAQAIAVFCVVARNGHPVPMGEIKRQLGIAQSSVSRNVALLGERNRHGRDGPDLVQSWENPDNRREKLVELTPAGHRLRTLLHTVLERRQQ